MKKTVIHLGRSNGKTLAVKAIQAEFEALFEKRHQELRKQFNDEWEKKRLYGIDPEPKAGSPGRCFQCHEPITKGNDGICINQDTPHQVFQCNDCHRSEFGVSIRVDLLWFGRQQLQVMKVRHPGR